MRYLIFLLLLDALPAWATSDAPRFIAHRGLAQDFSREGLDAETCTATRMLAPRHGYIENTIASMQAAFDAGAEQVELDIHPTSDGEFVVFHDWTLDCRTDGHGVTRGQTLAYLKSLDVGFGYTADDGATFAFRGRFKGAMPTWAEAMAAFPGRRFLVHIKGNEAQEARLVLDYVARHRIDTSSLTFYGGDRPIQALRAARPESRTMSRRTLVSCAWRYLLLGWSGYVPEDCRHSLLLVPVNYQAWVWGWPERFVARMAAAGSDVAVIGPVDRSTRTAGTVNVDDEATLDRIPRRYGGFVMTDRIDVLARAARAPAR